MSEAPVIFRVIDAGYTSACAVCRDGDQKLVAVPNANVWLCLCCLCDLTDAISEAYLRIYRAATTPDKRKV